MSTRMQQRRGTASQWISTNSGNGPILAAGEIGFESDTNKFKIGDGINHWVDLTYFMDAESALASIAGLVDGAPALLDTLNELAAAMGDDASFATTINNRINGVETALSDHNEDTTNIHGIANTSDLATKSYVSDAVSNSAVDQSALAGEGLSWNSTTDQFDVDETIIATQVYVDETIGTAVETHSDTTESVHGIADTAELSTKAFVAELLTTSTQSNIVITGDKDGLIITAENGVDDSTTDDLAEGTNHLYFTAERAQDAIGNSIGTGLTYTDATGEIKVDTTTIQTRVANVSDTEIGYLDGVSSAIQTQLNAKAPVNSPTFTGTISGITKSMVGLGDVDNTSDVDKPVSTLQASAIATAKSEAISDATSRVNAVIAGAPTALDTLNELAAALGNDANYAATITTSLGLKAPLAGPTFTGTVVLPNTTSIGNVSATEIGYLDGVTSSIQAQLDSKASSSGASGTYAPIASPTFTGTVSGITKSMVGLGNVDNTSDANKPVSTATQTALDAKLELAGGTMTGALTLSGAPTSDLHAATKLYVDGVASGINFHAPVKAATSTNISTTYSNGTNGYGATLTADANGAMGTVDGQSMSVGDRVLVKAQTDSKQNGIYVVTSLGGSSSKWVMTRAADSDNNPNGEMAAGDFCFVTAGTLSANTGYILSGTGTLAIGTDNINYVQFNAAQAIQAGTGLSKAGAVLSIDTAVTVDLSTAQTLSNKTLTAPVLGVATATSINGTTIPSSKTLVTTADSGTVTSTMIADGTIVDGDISSSAAIATSKISGLDAALTAKLSSATAASTYAPLASPALTGTPTAPTATAGTNTTQVATTAFVGTAVANLVASAPAALDTLNELAAALGNDSAFSTTVTNSLAAKAPLAGPTFTGTVTLPSTTSIGNVSSTEISYVDGVTSAIQTQLDSKLASLVTINSQTSSYTVVTSDKDKVIELNSGSANTITVPLDLNVPDGTQLDILQVGAGQTTIVAASGVTINATPGLKLRTQWSGATLRKRGTNLWVLVGDLTA